MTYTAAARLVVHCWPTRSPVMQIIHETKQRLLDAGLSMLLERGYNDLGIQALLDATHTPKGSFYHHFQDKEDFALQVVDQFTWWTRSGTLRRQ
jgi:AcrR family transcriptional regulator